MFNLFQLNLDDSIGVNFVNAKLNHEFNMDIEKKLFFNLFTISATSSILV